MRLASRGYYAGAGSGIGPATDPYRGAPPCHTVSAGRQAVPATSAERLYDGRQRRGRRQQRGRDSKLSD